ncbi:MAG: hypothetical protein ACLFQ5_01675 [Oceanicaulis sp.]
MITKLSRCTAVGKSAKDRAVMAATGALTGAKAGAMVGAIDPEGADSGAKAGHALGAFFGKRGFSGAQATLAAPPHQVLSAARFQVSAATQT